MAELTEETLDWWSSQLDRAEAAEDSAPWPTREEFRALVAAARREMELRRVAMEVAQQIRNEVRIYGFFGLAKPQALELAARLRDAAGGDNAG